MAALEIYIRRTATPASLSPIYHQALLFLKRKRIQSAKKKLAIMEPLDPIKLTMLPAEILHMIVSYLPTSSLIAVKLTNKRLYRDTISPSPGWPKAASTCEKKAVRRYINERKDLISGRRQCTTCNLITSTDRFPCDAPICKWHEQWFVSTTIPSFLETGLKARLVQLSNRTEEPKYIAIDRMYCAHNRDIVGWHVMDCECECDSCGHYSVKCYVRITRKLGNPRYAELSEDRSSVSEERWFYGQSRSFFRARDYCVSFAAEPNA
jgi:hypothetical protein